jgi:hypothetical protein
MKSAVFHDHRLNAHRIGKRDPHYADESIIGHRRIHLINWSTADGERRAGQSRVHQPVGTKVQHQ